MDNTTFEFIIFLLGLGFLAFICTMLQVCTLLSVFSFMIYYMKKNKINKTVIYV